MAAPNRKDTRDAFVTLLNTLVGASGYQEVISGDPGDQVQGQSPVAIVRSGGSRRPPMVRGTTQADNEFRLSLQHLVHQDTAAVDDVLDALDQALADLLAATANRSNANWNFIRFTDGFSDVISFTDYRVEVYDIIVRKWG